MLKARDNANLDTHWAGWPTFFANVSSAARGDATTIATVAANREKLIP